jgi:hypothetical protein
MWEARMRELTEKEIELIDNKRYLIPQAPYSPNNK